MSANPQTFLNAPMPDYTYVLRDWIHDNGAHQQAKVVVIRSDRPLQPAQIVQRLQEMELVATNFELVDMPRNSIAQLDTWERCIECVVPQGAPDVEVMAAWWDEARAPSAPAPIDMILHCPACGMQHVDRDEGQHIAPHQSQMLWRNPPHRSHLCRGCGHIWRPADVPTNGVAAIKTRGKDDSPTRVPPSAPAPAEVPMPVSEGTIAYEPQPYEPEWISSEPAYSESQLLAYAAAREAAERERVRGVLRELVESYRSLINTLGHEDATAADKEKAEARFACAEAAARAELCSDQRKEADEGNSKPIGAAHPFPPSIAAAARTMARRVAA